MNKLFALGLVACVSVITMSEPAATQTDIQQWKDPSDAVLSRIDSSGNFVGGVTGNVSGTATNVTGVVAIAHGGTGTSGTLTGLIRGSGSAMTAAELSGDCSTSGSNAVTCTATNGRTIFAPTYMTSDQMGISSTSCTNVTNMSWNIAASKNYTLNCVIRMTWSNGGTLGFCLNGPGTPTHLTIDAWSPTGASGAVQTAEKVDTGWGTKSTVSISNSQTGAIMVSASIQNGSTASGTALTLQVAGDALHLLTPRQDTECQLTQVN